MNNIAKYRKEHGLSQFQLAESLGLTQQTISKYEKGEREPDINTLIKLSKIFKVSLEELLGLDSYDNYVNTLGSENNIRTMDQKKNLLIKSMEESFFMRFIKLYCDNKLDFENEENFLGLTHYQISDIKSVRLPNLVELQQISIAFRVSINYLLGLPEFNLSEEEQELISYYNKLKKADKRLIMGNIVALMKQSSDNNYYNNVDMVAESKIIYGIDKEL